ncbi:hypothetical protein ENBRE01_1642 [Enteropsectra breve]|nr:hypothetical protein ENBRE01_1642 [Enteropsectra breve]
MIFTIDTEFKKYNDLEEARELLADIKEHGHEIRTLDLSMNTYAPVVFKEICKTIKNDMKELKRLKLESILDSLTYEDMLEILTDLAQALPLSLEVLELPSNAVSCKFPEAFGEFIAKCPLTVLDLYNCGLGEDGLVRIKHHLDALADKSKMVTLNLSRNRINRIADGFGSVLSCFTNLEELKMSSNTIEENSMADFLKNLKNKSLKMLDLSDNFLCGDCAVHLADIFTRNSMKTLLLQDAKFDEGNFEEFLSICAGSESHDLPGGMKLEHEGLVMDISCNDLDEKCVPELLKFVQQYKISRLVVFDNYIEDYSEIEKVVLSDGGCVVNEIKEDSTEMLSDSIIEKIKSL